MKNKILSILLIMISISFIFVNNIFAHETSYNDTVLYISDEAYSKLKTFDEYNSGEYNFFVIYWNGVYEYYFMPIKGNEFIKYRKPFYSSEPVKDIHYYVCDESFNVTTSKTINSWQFNSNYNRYDGTKYHFLTDVTIYTNISYEDIFYKVEAKTLAELLNANNPVNVFKENIGNTLIYLILFLVSLFAFYKGWAFLKQNLHKA